MAYVAVLFFAFVFVSACATAGKAVAPSLLPPLPSLAESGTDESRSEDIQRALASVGLLRLTNPYSTVPRFEPFGRNVFEASLEALEKEGCEKSDARMFACAVALSRLHRYSDAVEKYQLVSSASGLYEEAQKKAGEIATLGAIEKNRVAVSKDNSQTVPDSLSVLSAEREQWLAIVSDESRGEEMRSFALEEVERIDVAHVAVLGRAEQRDELSRALDGLLAQHSNSKNILSHKLLLAHRLLWQRELELVGKQDREEVTHLEERIKALLESVAAEDGTPEKIEALYLLRAFQVSVKRVRR